MKKFINYSTLFLLILGTTLFYYWIKENDITLISIVAMSMLSFMATMIKFILDPIFDKLISKMMK